MARYTVSDVASSPTKKKYTVEDVKKSKVEAGLDILPTAGGVVGGLFGPAGAALGGGAGEAYRQLGARAARAAGVNIKGAIPETPTESAKAIGKEAATQAVFEKGGRVAASVIGRGGREAAMKALGFTKRFLNNSKKLKAARDASQTMLDSGAIKLAETEPTLHGVKAMKDEAGGRIGQFLNKSGVGFDTSGVIRQLDALRPPVAADKRMAGHLADVNGAIDKAIDTIRAFGDGPLTFQQANDVKKILQDATKFGSTDASQRVSQSIAGTYRQFLDDTLEAASMAKKLSPEFAQFLKDKRLYQSASLASDALSDKLAGELGNKAFGLTDWLALGFGAGTGGTVAGPVGGAVGGATTLLVKRLAEKFGPQSAALIADYVGKNPRLLPNIARAAGLTLEELKQ